MPSGDTIAALATPFGAGAVAVTRISGPQAREIAGRLFRGRRPLAEVPPGRVVHGHCEHDGTVLDEVLVTVFRGPRSYTGEDAVEISGHGGVVVAQSILRAVWAEGARPAEPGEFTRRAFLHGKMDLTQAEAVMDLITARGEASARAAAGQLSGRLGKVVERLREEMLTALAHLEAFIDFPEEGIDPESGEVLLRRVADLSAAVARLLATADEGRMLREGVRLVIFGEPNAGKSSLLNLLVGYERAMVSEIPGTTRDTIEENLTLRGIPFRVIDTAGLRESSDPLEVEGMRRTRQHLEQAEVVVRVVDATISPVPVPATGREVCVLNKIDLRPAGSVPSGVVAMCCLDGRGLEELVEAIVARTDFQALGRFEEVVAVNARHQHCLRTAQEALDETRRSLERGDAPELTALELRGALVAVGEITGAVDTEEVLGKIFSTFCIGK
jgi:tRNA modification GTPase